jgi:hypothetical protein
MTTRLATADISYPFIPEVPDRKYIKGILDARIQIQGDSSLTAGSSGTKTAYTYLSSITQLAGPLVEFVFTSIFNFENNYTTYTTTFQITPGQGLVGASNLGSEATKGYLLVNSDFIYQAGNLNLTSPDYELEPCTVVWFNNIVKSISFVNEFRHYDPSQRTNLTNTVLKTFTAPETIKLRSGYNVDLSYGANSGILDVSGNAGVGLGLAPDNLWDTGPAWETDISGVVSINGVLQDDDGNIDIAGTNSVIFTRSEGSIDIEVTE